MSGEPARRGSLATAAKVCFDVAVAAVLLIAALPLIVAIIAAIELESPGPVFYRAHRIGYRGRPFRMLKFRKMRPDADGRPLTLTGDTRFTRVGAVLARTKLDELPQLVNVLCAQMSLVGPRPEDPRFVAVHADAYERILHVRPGITGRAQLAFAREASILDPADPVRHYLDAVLPQKVWLDLRYVHQHKPWDDVRILAWTLITVALQVPVAVDRRTGALSRRRPRARTMHVPSPAARLYQPEARVAVGAHAREVAGASALGVEEG
ncbi:MAG TPA: sugar transferase [Solirubrobacteraceae bacterium]